MATLKTDNRRRGYIIQSYSVVCGVCDNEMMTGGRSASTAREDAARQGWTKDLVCSRCRPGGIYASMRNDDGQ